MTDCVVKRISDEPFSDLYMLVPGLYLTEYLATLTVLPREAKGFTVKTYLKRTDDGRGIGVFAGEFLPANTRLDSYNEIIFGDEQFCSFIGALPNNEQRVWWLEHSYYYDKNVRIATDFDANMVNHSYKPNVISVGECDMSVRDIEKGEELLEDYSMYNEPSFFKELCLKYGACSYDTKWN